jgi:cbb3-type cytochrome oxidase subunit 3
MVVYGGLAIAGTLFLQAIGIVLRYKVKNKGLIYKYVDIALTLAKLALVFICTVTIYHLYKGEEANLFTVSNESLATLAVLLICVFLSLFRRKK